MTAHGGDMWQASAELGIPVSELLDFSANINPRGLPARAMKRLAGDASDLRSLTLYPDPSARRLRGVLSAQLDVPDEAIVVGPGAEALLAPILGSLQVQRALVPVPAFSEYRRVCTEQNIEYVPFPLERSECFRTSADRLCRRIETENCGVVLLNNPHNPSGAILFTGEVRRILETARSCGATMLLDEAFIDYAPHQTLAAEAAARTGLIVLRSLTKFYGCPALRVGYAVAHPETIPRIASLLPTWPVTQLALDAITEAVGDTEYAEESLRENAARRDSLSEALKRLGLVVFPSAANYLLLELGKGMPRAAELRMSMLVEHRILIRNCDSYEGLSKGRYFRVAVRSASENDLLVEALATQLESR